MNAEKHVTVILLIVVVIVALVSTYAWFSVASNNKVVAVITSGENTSFSFTDGSGEITQDKNHVGFDDYPGYDTEEQTHTPMYAGQKGYHYDDTLQTPAWVAYTGSDAPFYLFKNIPYKMYGASNVTLSVILEKFIVTLDQESYNYNFNQTLTNICGVADVGSIATSDYIVLNSSFKTNKALEPSTGSQEIFMSIDDEDENYVANNTATYNVIAIIYKGTEVSKYMTLNYWKSNQSNGRVDGEDNPLDSRGVLPSESHTSAVVNNVNSGITLIYPTDVCEAGMLNYVGVYVGFYGYQNGHYTQCLFSEARFRGSTFYFILSAGAGA